MAGVLLAEAAVLVHFKTIGVVLLVLHGIVITLLALGACHRNLDTLIRCHYWTPPIMFDAAPAGFAAAVISPRKQQPTSGADY